MTGRILVCRCCGEPLTIVCPNHGSDYGGVIVPDHREHLSVLELRPGTIRERLFLALPADTDPPHEPIDQFAGRIEALTRGPATAQVRLALPGGLPLRAAVNAEAAEALGLAVGQEALAMVKASEVVLVQDLVTLNLIL